MAVSVASTEHLPSVDDCVSSTTAWMQRANVVSKHHRTDLAALESLLFEQLQQPSSVSSFRRAKRVRQWIRAVLQDAEMSSAYFSPRPRWQAIESWFANQKSQWERDANLAGVRLKTSISSELHPQLWIDIDFVSVILDHFISNAILNSQLSEAVQVSIRVSKDEEPWLSIEVRDQSNDEVDKLRDHVTWSKSTLRRPYLPPVLGHGLGLRVAVRYAALMHGYVDFSNLPGEGTAFSLHLPAGGIYAWLIRTRRRHTNQADFDHGRSMTALQVYEISTRHGTSMEGLLADIDHLHALAEWRQLDESRVILIPTTSEGRIRVFDDEHQGPNVPLDRLIPALASSPTVSEVEVLNLGSLDAIIAAIERGVSAICGGTTALPGEPMVSQPAAKATSQYVPKPFQTSGRIASPVATQKTPVLHQRSSSDTHAERSARMRADRPHLRPPIPKLRFRDLEALEFEHARSTHHFEESLPKRIP